MDRQPWHPWGHIGGVLPLLLLVTAVLPAVEVSAEWGFDGRVVPGRFNPLFVTLHNPTDAPFDETIALHRSIFAGQIIGTPIVEPVYLSPGASQELVFHPWISADGESWTLSWGSDLSYHEDLEMSEGGLPACVLLIHDDPYAFKPPQIPTLVERRFPESVTGTETLDSVLLDHLPRWNEAQRRAFRDWLHAGGTVHLLQDGAGEYPTFDGDLALLESASAVVHVGAGTVVRHGFTRRDLRPDLLRQAWPAGRFEEVEQQPYYRQPRGHSGQEIVGLLGERAQPEFPWILIGICALLYAALVVPGSWLLARRLRTPWIPRIHLVAMVIVFSGCFLWLGRRGYGESWRLDSLSYARILSDNAVVVTEWSSLFVTMSGRYQISPPGPGHLHHVIEPYGPVPGSVRREDGALEISMPLFSNRGFTHRCRIDDSPVVTVVHELLAGDGLLSLAVELDADLSERAHFAAVVYRGQIHDLGNVTSSLLTYPTDDDSSSRLTGRFDALFVHNPLWGARWRSADDPADEASTRQGVWLMGRASGMLDASRKTGAMGDGTKWPVQLFVYADRPGSWSAGEAGPPSSGQVLYHVTLWPTEEADD